MQDRHLFEYAVIRVVPRVEREEFLNVGVIVYCADEGFLRIKYLPDMERISAFGPGLNISELQKMLLAAELICSGQSQGGPISKLPIASRFRWLTATRSTVLQSSAVHPGFCNNAEETLNKLYEVLVL